ncbi:hypothetical protein D3C76_956740 [compost metagenome]
MNPRAIHQPQLLVLDGVVGDVKHGAVHDPVLGEGKGLNLDLHLLARAHEADVLVLQHGFHLHRLVLGHNHHQRLGFGDHAARGVDGQLLHGAVHRGGEAGQAIALFGLGQFLLQASGTLLRLVLQVEHGAAGLGEHALAAAFGLQLGGLELEDSGLLDGQLALLVQAPLFSLQEGVLADDGLVQQALVVGDQLAGDGQGFLQLGYPGLGGLDLGHALGDLGVALFQGGPKFQVLALEPGLRRGLLLRSGLGDANSQRGWWATVLDRLQQRAGTSTVNLGGE